MEKVKTAKLCVSILFILLIGMIFYLPAFAEEFSGEKLNVTWIIENSSGKSGVGIANGYMGMNISTDSFQDAKSNHAPKLLKDQLSGDWIIDTNLVSNSNEQDKTCFTGLVIYKNEHNWMGWGQSGTDGLAAVGVINGKDTGNIATCEIHNFYRIRKLSNNIGDTTYYFYYSDDRVAWTNAGIFEDKNDSLSKARYGFIGMSKSSEFAVSYDYFTEFVPQNEYDDFTGNTVDMIWKQQKHQSEIYVDAGNLAMNVSIEDGIKNAPLLLKSSMSKDFIIDTSVLQQAGQDQCHYGLILYRDNGNWLLWGQKDIESMEVSGMINGKPTGIIGSVKASSSRLRIKKEGRKYLFDYSEDGITWKNCARYTDGWWLWKRLSKASYGLGAIGNGTTKYYIKFDFFRERPTPDGVLKDIVDLKEVARLTGEESINNTAEKYNVYGCDLGSLVDDGSKVFMMFGDTFGPAKGNWRSNTLAVIKDDKPADGLSFDSMVTDDFGEAKEVINSKHVDFDEMTRIPTYGIFLDNKLYYSFMSVFHWGAGAHWDCNYSKWTYSEDEGKTWLESDSPAWGPSSNFNQLACVKDGRTVYVYGTPSGRFGGVKLAKVQEDKILDSKAYEYYIGKNFFGMPRWSDDEKEAIDIIPAPVGEISVSYNKYLGKWLITYLSEHSFDIEMREAGKPWGAWSKPVTLVDHNIPDYRSWVYGAYMLPKYVEGNGEIMYFSLSKWVPYSVYWQKVRLVK